MNKNTNLVTIHESPNPSDLPLDDFKDQQLKKKDLIQFEEIELDRFALDIFQKIDDENKEEEIARIRKWVKNRRFYRGQQRGFFDPSGEWIVINPDDYKPTEASMLVINNQVRPKIKTLGKEWSRSQSRLRCKSVSDDPANKGAARYSTSVLALYQRKQLTEDFKQRESKHAFLCGNYFRYTYYSPHSRSGLMRVPDVEDKTIKPGKDYSECSSCDMTWDEGDENTPDAGESCPECQEGTVEKKEFPSFQASVKSGYKKQHITGDVYTELVDPMEIKVHLRARTVETTPYLRRKRLVYNQLLKFEFPYAEFGSSGGVISPISYYTIELETSVGNRGGRLNSLSSMDYQNPVHEMVEFDQLWLDNSMYFNLKLKEDYQKADGTILKAGTKLIDEYPDGWYLAKANNTLLDMRNEDKNEYWTHGNYDILTDSFYGDGLEDMMQHQQFINEMQSLLVENTIYNASPKIIFNPHLIEHELLSGRPKEMTPMSPNARRDDEPQKAVLQLEGMPLSTEAHVAMENAKMDMNEMAGSSAALSGGSAAGVPSTATGLAIMRDMAIALLGTALALKSLVEIEWSYQVLEHLQNHFVPERYAGLLGSYSVEEAQAFADCDIRNELEIIAEPGSWMPRTDLEVRNDFLTYLTAGGIPLGFANPQVPDAVREQASEIFRMPFDMDKLMPARRIAQIRLDQILDIAEYLVKKKRLDPNDISLAAVQILTSDIPVDTFIDDHVTIIKSYKEFMEKDEGIFAFPCVKQAVRFLVHKHMDAIQKLKIYDFKQQAQFQVAAQALQGAVNSAQGLNPDGSPPQPEEQQSQQTGAPPATPPNPQQTGSGQLTPAGPAPSPDSIPRSQPLPGNSLTKTQLPPEPVRNVKG